MFKKWWVDIEVWSVDWFEEIDTQTCENPGGKIHSCPGVLQIFP